MYRLAIHELSPGDYQCSGHWVFILCWVSMGGLSLNIGA